MRTSARVIMAKEDYHPYTISKIDLAIVTFNLRRKLLHKFETRLIRDLLNFIYLFNPTKFKLVFRHVRRINTASSIFLSNNRIDVH